MMMSLTKRNNLLIRQELREIKKKVKEREEKIQAVPFTISVQNSLKKSYDNNEHKAMNNL